MVKKAVICLEYTDIGLSSLIIINLVETFYKLVSEKILNLRNDLGLQP